MNNEIEKREQQFEEIRGIITFHRSKALQGVNEESLMMSWRVGQVVSHRLKNNEWGSKVVTQLSEYLRTKDPSLKGYSRRNIYNMVMFYEAYSSEAFRIKTDSLKLQTIVQKPSAQLDAELVQTDSANFLEQQNQRDGSGD